MSALSKYRQFAPVLIVLIVLLTLMMATQVIASHLQYDPILGPPLIQMTYPWNKVGLVFLFFCISALGWTFYQTQNNWFFAAALGGSILIFPLSFPLYNPLACWDWYPLLKDNPALQTVWPHVALILGMGFSLAFIVGFIFYVSSLKANKDKPADTFGSARWAEKKDIEISGLLGDYDPHAAIVGGWQDPKTNVLHYLRSTGAEHIFCYAPTRSGKGVGLVIPTLLIFAKSAINSDFKLENWTLTAGWRKYTGSLVFKFDPTCTDGSGARYNPLLEVRLDINEVRDVQNITDMLVNPDGKGKSDHWSNAASSLITSTILHVLYAEKDKSLTGVRNFLANPHRTEKETLEYMLTTKHDVEESYGWVDISSGKATFTHPIVASGAREMLNKTEGERTSIISTALTFLKLYRDPIIAANTRVSDFTINDLVNHEKPATLYLGIPPSDIERTMPLLRLILNQILSRLTEKMDFTQGLYSGAGRHQLLLLLDEFPQFGRLAFFEKALAYMAGYGIRAFLISQDLTQLYAQYGHQQSIIANCHIRTAYAPNSLETANHLSQLLGDTTKIVKQQHYSGRRMDIFLKNVSTHEHEVKRPLFTPDELMRLGNNKAIIFKTGMPPIAGHKIYYYDDPILYERSKIPAPVESDRLKVKHPWNTVIEPAKILSEDINQVEENDSETLAYRENNFIHEDEESDNERMSMI